MSCLFNLKMGVNAIWFTDSMLPSNANYGLTFGKRALHQVQSHSAALLHILRLFFIVVFHVSL